MALRIIPVVSAVGNIPTRKCHILKIRKIHQEILYPSIVNIFQNVHKSQLLNSFFRKVRRILLTSNGTIIVWLGIILLELLSKDCVLQQELLDERPTIPYVATAATRLFQKGIDEQLIMKVTGHRSIDGVRAYKRPSIEQFKEISGVLQKSVDESIVPTKRIKQDDDEKENQEPTSAGTNVPSFTFQHCSNVTINVSK